MFGRWFYLLLKVPVINLWIENNFSGTTQNETTCEFILNINCWFIDQQLDVDISFPCVCIFVYLIIDLFTTILKIHRHINLKLLRNSNRTNENAKFSPKIVFGNPLRSSVMTKLTPERRISDTSALPWFKYLCVIFCLMVQYRKMWTYNTTLSVGFLVLEITWSHYTQEPLN